MPSVPTPVSQFPAADALTGDELIGAVQDGSTVKTTAQDIADLAGSVTIPVPPTEGGTGLISYTQGDLLYAPAVNTLAKLAKNTTATRYLSNTGTSNDPAWAQVNLTNGVTGTLPVGNGGTGIASYAQGDILFASAGATLSALAKDTNATRYLSNTGASNNPAWAQVSLTTGVSGTLPLGNGGTGQITANAALNALLPAQTGHGGEFLQTDGTNTSWAAGGGGAVTGSFEGTLEGFAAPLVGDINYILQNGIVTLYIESAEIFIGSSTTTELTLEGLPVLLRPPTTIISHCLIGNGGTQEPGAAVIDNTDTIIFLVAIATGSIVQYDGASFADDTTDKGLLPGWILQYPLA